MSACTQGDEGEGEAIDPHGSNDSQSCSDSDGEVDDDSSTSGRLAADELEALKSQLSAAQAEVTRLQEENRNFVEENSCLRNDLAKFSSPGLEQCMTDDSIVHYYTGLPSREVFDALVEHIESFITACNSSNRGRRRHLSTANEFFLVLMRLRLALQVEDLRYRFQLPDKARVSKILKRWFPLLAKAFRPLLVWPSKKEVKRNLPTAFRENSTYCNVRLIIDCAEFEMETPSALSLNSMTYSDYKGRNMVKVLFGVTPDGYISFVSRAYPGSKSDNSITLKSGILDMLSPGDEIMADKGFTLSNVELQSKGLKLVVPPFRCAGGAFTSEEVEVTKEIANLRLVVENCIMRTRYVI